MYIGIISDTHGVFSDGFRKFLEPVDEIWHAGDFGGGIEFVAGIAAFKPLVGVWGNCDGQDIRAEYPEFKFLELQGLRILLKHIGGSPGHYDKDARVLLDAYKPDVFVCGHSHILKVMNDRQRSGSTAAGSTTWKSSSSPAPPVNRYPPSLSRLRPTFQQICNQLPLFLPRQVCNQLLPCRLRP